jgi:hypothetical protein
VQHSSLSHKQFFALPIIKRSIQAVCSVFPVYAWHSLTTSARISPWFSHENTDGIFDVIAHFSRHIMETLPCGSYAFHSCSHCMAWTTIQAGVYQE